MNLKIIILNDWKEVMSMLDIKIIRENPDLVKKSVASSGKNMDEQIDKILEIDTKRRELIASVESMKSEQNATSKKIPELKKAGKDISAILGEMKILSDKISKENDELTKLEEKQREILLSIPNMPNKDVPIGLDDSENI